jgi:hypothetical protein
MGTDETRNGLLPVAILLVIAVLVAGAVFIFAGGGGATSGDPQSSGTSGTSAGEDGSASEQLVPTTAPKDGVVLPEGSSEVDGYPVKFPYTDLGAVAVQAQVAESQVGFDYDQATTVARIYADPADRAVFEQRSADAVAERRRMAEVSVMGEVPAPASYAATPIAFTVTELDTDYYVVNLLSYITLTTADGKTHDTIYAGTQLVRWVDGDWKLVHGTGAEYQQLIDEGQPQAAVPGTPAYEQAGWIPINGELQ